MSARAARLVRRSKDVVEHGVTEDQRRVRRIQIAVCDQVDQRAGFDGHDVAVAVGPVPPLPPVPR